MVLLPRREQKLGRNIATRNLSQSSLRSGRQTIKFSNATHLQEFDIDKGNISLVFELPL